MAKILVLIIGANIVWGKCFKHIDLFNPQTLSSTLNR